MRSHARGGGAPVSAPRRRARRRRRGPRCSGSGGGDDGDGPVHRVAVIGAGLAGIGVAHALVRRAAEGRRRLRVVVFDESGAVAGGASGAAAGLLHPLAPARKKKKEGDAAAPEVPRLLFRGMECVEATRENLRRAEGAYRRRGMDAEADAVADCRAGILKMEAREAAGAAAPPAPLRALCTDPGGARVVPGGSVPSEARRLAGAGGGPAVFMGGGLGVTVDTVVYLEGLWLDAVDTAARAAACTLELRARRVRVVADLADDAAARGGEGFDDVVVAAGAGVGRLCVRDESEMETGDGAFQRIARAASACVGHVVRARAGGGSPWRGPSVYTARGEYLATHAGGREVTAGATKMWRAGGDAPGRTGSRWGSYAEFVGDAGVAPEERDEVAAMWARLGRTLEGGAGGSWVPASVRSGVRLCPPRHPVQGAALPIVGRIRAGEGDEGRAAPRMWCLLGLGFRGVVFHALFADILAARVAEAARGGAEADVGREAGSGTGSDLSALVECALPTGGPVGGA